MADGQIFVVFDVESVGLHGEGFAVGVTVVGDDGHRYQEELYACDPAEADGTDEDRAWIAKHCPFIPRNCGSPEGVRRQFWTLWQTWQAEGALLAADVAWPVEARFLIACVDDDPEHRTWEGPYPLIDIASVVFAAGGDPLKPQDRHQNELPEHNPLADARQSARLLLIARRVRAAFGAMEAT